MEFIIFIIFAACLLIYKLDSQYKTYLELKADFTRLLFMFNMHHQKAMMMLIDEMVDAKDDYDRGWNKAIESIKKKIEDIYEEEA